MWLALGAGLPLFPGEKQAREEGRGSPEGDMERSGVTVVLQGCVSEGSDSFIILETAGKLMLARQVVTVHQLHGTLASTTSL